MNTQQIDYFLMVADSKSSTAAAQKLYVSQPAVSRMIAALENELGCELFDRHDHKAAVLTPAGKLFYDTFRQTRQIISSTIQKAHELAGKESGTFRLGVRSGLDVSIFVASLLKQVSLRYPDIALQIDSYELSELRAALMSKQIDGAILMEDQLYPIKDIETQPLWECPRILLYSRRHPLAEQGALTPKVFQDTPFLVVEDAQVEMWVTRYLENYGFKPKVVQVPNVESMVMGIESLQGVGIMAGISRLRTNTEFGFLPVDSYSRIVLAWLSYCSNPLLTILRKEAAAIAPPLSKEAEAA